MKILVCISVVPDTTTKIKFTGDKKSLDKNGVQFIINPYDEFGLTKAIKLKEKNGGSITVIHVGPAENDSVIRKSLAIGADDAFRIDAEAKDGIMVAQEIAQFAKDKNFDLIITGRESIDYNGGIVPHALGELMGIPSVSPCIGLEIENNAATLETYIDGGKQKFKANLPIVIGSQKGLVEENELIIPNMRGIMMARSKPYATVASVGSSGCQTVDSLELPPEKAPCKMIDAGNVDELVNLLQNEAKVI